MPQLHKRGRVGVGWVATGTLRSCSPNVLTASPTEPLETRHYPVSALERSQRRGGAAYR